MNRMLNYRDAGVRAALALPMLQDLEVLGRGTFSNVYDKGDTVLKLTIDPASYAYLTHPDLSEHAPRLIRDFGAIGEDQEGHPLYLLEVEKLLRLQKGSAAKKQAGQVYRTYRAAFFKSFNLTSSQEQGQNALSHVTDMEGLPQSVLDTLRDIEYLVCNRRAFVDLMKMCNYMERPDGTLVFSDPVCDWDLFQQSFIS